MKIFNVVLAGLIFLLAAVSAVFSFFLFEKRAQLVTNYEQMGKQMSESAKTLDSGTNTGVAAKVTTKELSHSNSTNLPTALKNFDNLAKEVIRERDALAQALYSIASTLESNQFTEQDFKDFNTYSGKIQALSDYVAKSKKNHDNALESIASVAKRNNVRVSVEDLKAGQFSTVVNKINANLKQKETLIANYQTASRNLTNAVRVPFNPSAPTEGLNAVKSKYTQINNENGSLKNKVNSLNSTIAGQNKTISNLRLQINNLKKVITEKDRMIASLHKDAGLELGKYKPIAPGSREALNMVRTQLIGKVLVVDEKFGFVTISLGKKTYVVNEYIKKGGIRYIDPQIPVNAELYVVRPQSDDKTKTEYISSVKITKLDDYCSIAEPNDPHGKSIQVGDIVYFSDKSIDEIIKNRK